MVFRVPTEEKCFFFDKKQDAALFMLQDSPLKWFRDAPIDQRDFDLIRSERVPWLDYSQQSYARKIYHMKAGESFEMTNWTVESNDACKELIRSAGGKLVGFDSPTAAPIHWASVTVNVNISGTPHSALDWAFLSTRPANIRIFKGPAESCSSHPWDAMILRDCTSNGGSLYRVEEAASRKWDILCMKVCEDHDSPWVVVAVKDTGAASDLNDSHDCQDTSACGCTF